VIENKKITLKENDKLSQNTKFVKCEIVAENIGEFDGIFADCIFETCKLHFANSSVHTHHFYLCDFLHCEFEAWSAQTMWFANCLFENCKFEANNSKFSFDRNCDFENCTNNSEDFEMEDNDFTLVLDKKIKAHYQIV
jgi:hypothetical protein